MSSEHEEFCRRNREMIQKMGADASLKEASGQLLAQSAVYEYSYHFSWMGRPIIQFPQDMVAMQEIIWNTRPDLVIETGIARGGSLIFYASMLRLLGKGEVLGIDIDIREHNRVEIENHFLADAITMIEGSSTDPEVFRAVQEFAAGRERIMVCLDSSHTHDHVLRELKLYSGLVTPGNYLVVFDTVIELLPDHLDVVANRPWGKGNNPMTAVREFLKESNRFEVDREMEDKLLLTAAPGGYLRCIR